MVLLTDFWGSILRCKKDTGKTEQEAFQITPAESDYIRSCYTLAQPSEYYKKKNIFQLVFVVSLVKHIAY